MTQSALAKALKIDQQSISRWEHGKHHPSIETIVEIAGILHTTSDYLLGRTGDPKPLSEDERRLLAWLRGLKRKPTAEDLLRFFDRQYMPKRRQPRAFGE